MINFYGGQKGENYVVSQIFANTEELKKDLALDENSPVGLNEIVMISYGEYTNDGTGAYWTNLKVDNPTFTGEEDYSDIKIYNSSFYQKVPNGNLAADDIVGEKVTYDDNGQANFVPINLYKYKFLSSSMGQIPRLILKTGEAIEAWETPLVTEDETSQIAQPIFNLSMPKAPTIIGSDGTGGKDVGILINYGAPNGNIINPYELIQFDIKEDTTKDTYKYIDEKDKSKGITYDTVNESVFGVRYQGTNINSEFQEIKNIRGPEGLPGRIPQVVNGKWYNWEIDESNSTKLKLMDSGISASFVVYAVEQYNISDSGFTNIDSEKTFINQVLDKVSEKYTSLIQYNNQIIVANCYYSEDRKFTLACFKDNKNSWSWTYFVANASNFLIESGTGTNSIQQYNTEAKATGIGAVAFGDNTYAVGNYSFAEGQGYTKENEEDPNETTGAFGNYSHVEGVYTTAKGLGSHAEGSDTVAIGSYQHVEGKHNIPDTRKNMQHDNHYIHIAGNGTVGNPSNAYTLDWDGNSWFQGSVISRTYSIILSANDWQESQDEDNVNKYTQQIVLNDFNSHDKDWSVIVNPVYTNNMTKLELQNYQREYNRLSSGYILTETTQDKDEIIKFTVFDRPPQGDLTIMIKVV